MKRPQNIAKLFLYFLPPPEKNIHPFIIMVQNHFLVITARILKSLIPLFSSQAV